MFPAHRGQRTSACARRCHPSHERTLKASHGRRDRRGLYAQVAAPLANTDQGVANLAKADRHACRHAAPSNLSFSETKSTNEETARAICLRFGKAAYTLAASCRYSPSTLTRLPARISATDSKWGSSAMPSPATAACITARALLARNLPDTVTSIRPDGPSSLQLARPESLAKTTHWCSASARG